LKKEFALQELVVIHIEDALNPENTSIKKKEKQKLQRNVNLGNPELRLSN